MVLMLEDWSFSGKNKKTFYPKVKGYKHRYNYTGVRRYNQLLVASVPATGRSPDLQIIASGSLPGFPVTY